MRTIVHMSAVLHNNDNIAQNISDNFPLSAQMLSNAGGKGSQLCRIRRFTTIGRVVYG